MSARTVAAAVPINALDEVVLLEAGRIRTRKAITANEPYFPGHYPDHPVYPGVFIVEAVCQAVARYAAHFGAHVALSEIVSTRFRLPLQPGDVLEVMCDCTHEPAGNGLTVKAQCTSALGKVADIKALFEVEDGR